MTTVDLNTGRVMPAIGLGVFQVSDTDVCEEAVTTALQSGYRLVDTAAVYGNERAVGRAVAASDVPRDEIFVTSKIWVSDYGLEGTERAIDGSLERLGMDSVDLMLLHQPYGDVRGAWQALEQAVDDGRIGAIGVSNFTAEDVTALLEYARITPAVDQVEIHPYHQQPELLEFLRGRGIVPEAWYPLGHGAKELLAEPVIATIASAHGVGPVQVILRWHVQRGVVAIPKSTSAEHIAANLDIDGFELSDAQMTSIKDLDRGRPYFRVPRWIQRATLPLMRPRDLG